uniref:Inactive rhomboid protein 1 n=1 Tax=Aceria tosichella TaxID=561515 RepID=A0A6G1SKE9_9ACAR
MGAWDKVANLFGVGHHDETDSYAIKHQTAWLERRKRLLNRRCGRLVGESCQMSNQDHHGRLEQRSHRDKRSPRHWQPRSESHKKETSESKLKTQINYDDDDDNNINDDQKVRNARDNVHSPLHASFVPTTTHAPITRTTSDTAIHHTTVTPRYPKDLNQDNVSYSSYYDLTDFDAKESITKLVNDVLVRHQPKRAFGMGLVGKLLSRKFRKDLTNAQINAIYSFNDHRPYFTYWVTTVQILIMIITLFTYGFGPFGLNRTLERDTVFVPSLSWQHEAYYEKDNIWLGPRSGDLIHLGAKFTPCMRRDSLIFNEIQQDREDERLTGCCIRNDQSGCLQTTKAMCSSDSKWHSWNESTQAATILTSAGKRRRSGPVCGQDPQYCHRPASTHPHEWPDDITQWPICYEKIETTKQSHHMSCEVVGRPCCIGIYGQCRITTSQHCQFLRGTFHPEATLCSQVSCMEDVCGMVPFYARDYPDQFYRLITALFLHAGLIHLSFTIIIQYYIMRDIERLIGSTRMAILYILPGVAGYLASATFVPYHTQVGPSGSQFALLACLMAETINSWKLLEDPASSLGKLISIAIGLFILGLLPWIDNYAHIFGFIVGLMLSLALTPYLTPFNDAYSRRKKVIQIWVCILLVILTFVLLPLPLYIFPLYKCSWCQYLDCWPLAPNWCENQDIKVTRLDIQF